MNQKEKIIVGGYKTIEALALPGMTVGNFIAKQMGDKSGDGAIAFGLICSVAMAPVTLVGVAVFGPILMGYDKVFGATDILMRPQREGREESLRDDNQ